MAENTLKNIRLSRNIIKQCYETPHLLKDIEYYWVPESSWLIREILKYMKAICEGDVHQVTKEELECALDIDRVQDADVICAAYEEILNDGKRLTTIERQEVIAAIKKMKIKDAYMDAMDNFIRIKDSSDNKTIDEHMVYVRNLFTLCEVSVDKHRVDIDSVRDIDIDKVEYIPEKYGLVNKGYERGSLSVYVGPSNSGKSIFLCNEAVFHSANGQNVVFITLEMSANSVAKRINQNRFDVTEADYYDLIIHKQKYAEKVEQYRSEHSRGRLQIAELPTGEATSDDIEFEIKAFESVHGKVDVLIVDYIQIMKSKAQFSGGKNNNMYDNGKQIASSLRALAMKYNIVVISAAQTNRDGLYGMQQGQAVIAESAAIYHTCDNVFMIGIDPNDRSCGELTADKVRDSSTKGSRIPINIDYSRMKVTKKFDDILPEIIKDNASTEAVDQNGFEIFGGLQDTFAEAFADINGTNFQ